MKKHPIAPTQENFETLEKQRFYIQYEVTKFLALAELDMGPTQEGLNNKAVFEAMQSALGEARYFENIETSYDYEGHTFEICIGSLYRLLVDEASMVQVDINYSEGPDRVELVEIFDKANELIALIEASPDFIKYAESIQDHSFNKYLENLGLSISDLKQANKIVDVGAGDRLFAGYCISKGVNINTWSIEPGDSPEIGRFAEVVLNNDQKSLVEDQTIRAYAEDFVMEGDSADLIVANFFPNMWLSDSLSPEMLEMEHDYIQSTVRGTFRNLISILDSGGELRMYPLKPRKSEQGHRYYNQQVLATLDEYKEAGTIDYRFEEVNESDGGEEIIERLILVKR
ncbi:MAG: hypothetical protein ABIA47_02260 [bacterium]